MRVESTQYWTQNLNQNQNLNQTSASKYRPNFSFKISTELKLVFGNMDLRERSGLNHHLLEKMCDVTPVTYGRTDEEGGK